MNEHSFLKSLGIFAYLLVIIGAINWGLVGVFKFDLVAFLFGEMSKISRIVYGLVGLSALISVVVTSMCAVGKECE